MNLKHSSFEPGEFSEAFAKQNFSEVRELIYSKNKNDVERALAKKKRDLSDFMALISPAAAPYLEQMAQEAQSLTQKRFGKTIQLYIPLYLSNECLSSCTYCGFRKENEIPRVRLTKEEVLKEVEILKSWGYESVLLVTGDMNKKAGRDYLLEAISWIRPYFAQISAEVQPMDQADYELLRAAGLNGVMIYQETYGPNYKEFHYKGSKSNFNYRLQTPDRLGKAGIHKIGLGCLLGIEDWRADSWMVAFHLEFLKKTYWRTKFSISFPRLRPAEGVLEPGHPVNDKELAQLICAYRLLDENLELSLSTRESSEFRDHAIHFGITSLSAGSKTDPGGYASEKENLEQFSIDDDRSAFAVASKLKSQGLEAVFKDWEKSFG
ncbi:MAG: 2-iminoacetate synthase ThiH [SAR324 cluster bacterium]|nr:2-iminoacetate synthase ThiH [SAR324 cluster bacterium]